MSLLSTKLKQQEQDLSIDQAALARIRARVSSQNTARAPLFSLRNLRFATAFAVIALIVVAATYSQSPVGIAPQNALAAALKNTFGTSYSHFYLGNDTPGTVTHRVWEITSMDKSISQLETWSDGTDMTGRFSGLNAVRQYANYDHAIIGDERCTFGVVGPIRVPTMSCVSLTSYINDQQLPRVTENLVQPTDDFNVSVSPATLSENGTQGFLMRWTTPNSINLKHIEPGTIQAPDFLFFTEGGGASGTVNIYDGPYRVGEPFPSPDQVMESGIIPDSLLSIEYTNNKVDTGYEHARFFSHSLSNMMYGFTFQIHQDKRVSDIYHYDPNTNSLSTTSLEQVEIAFRQSIIDQLHEMPIRHSIFQPLYFTLLNNQDIEADETYLTELDDVPVTYSKIVLTSSFDIYTNQWKKREALGGPTQYMELWVDEANNRVMQYQLVTPVEPVILEDGTLYDPGDTVETIKLIKEEQLPDDPATFFNLDAWKQAHENL